MLIPFWIQRADLSFEDYAAVDYKKAQSALEKVDWHTEKLRQTELKSAKKENCDPGIGFVADDDRVLRICPDGEGNAYFHYHYPRRFRVLGLIPLKFLRTASRKRTGELDLPELIRRFFLNDHDWLIAKAKGSLRDNDQLHI